MPPDYYLRTPIFEQPLRTPQACSKTYSVGCVSFAIATGYLYEIQFYAETVHVLFTSYGKGTAFSVPQSDTKGIHSDALGCSASHQLWRDKP